MLGSDKTSNIAAVINLLKELLKWIKLDTY
jgi:hypothetical protein